MDKAVLFDLEETLVQTPWSNRQHVLDFRRRTREKLIQLGIPATVLEGVERATIMRNRAAQYVEQNLSETEAERFRRKMETFVSSYELDAAKKSRLFPETVSTLKMLRRLGAKTGLVTNTSREAVSTVFHVHDLEKYFDVVVTRENVERLKPSPEGILLAAKKLGVKRFFMVGDLAIDVLAAKCAGGKAIVVRRGSEERGSQDFLKSLPEEVLREAKVETEKALTLQADYVVQSLVEVPAIIQSEGSC